MKVFNIFLKIWTCITEKFRNVTLNKNENDNYTEKKEEVYYSKKVSRRRNINKPNATSKQACKRLHSTKRDLEKFKDKDN